MLLETSIVTIFSSEKKDFWLCHASLQISKKNICSIKFFYVVFVHVWGIVSFSCCKEAAWDNFWWFFSLSSHSLFSHLSCRSLRIPPCFSLTTSIIFFNLALRGFALLGRSSDVPSSLTMFRIWYTVYLATFQRLIIFEFVPSN